MWLIMVGMDTVEPSKRGVLGVVIRERAESPEEQYDRLVRAEIFASFRRDCLLSRASTPAGSRQWQQMNLRRSAAL